MLGIAIFLALVAVAAFLAALGWTLWKPNAVAEFPKWRNALELVSLSALSIQILVVLVFEMHRFVGNNPSYRTEEFPFWSAVDFYLAVVVILASVFGKGRSRISVFVATVALEIAWFLLGTGV